MRVAAPDGMRWCKVCNAFLEISKFGNYRGAHCYEHWLIWNKERRRRYNAEHPGYDAARVRRSRNRNPERWYQYSKRQAARQKSLGYPVMKRWKAQHPEQIREIWRRSGQNWRDRNRTKVVAGRNRKRARHAGAPGHHTGVQLQAISQQFEGLCAYCGGHADSWDHIVPLVAGGSNFAWNMIPACRACNSKKQDAPVEEYLIGKITTEVVCAYIEECLRLHKLMPTGSYVRRRYDKISADCLWDELIASHRIVQRDLRWADVRRTRYSVATYARRIGTIEQINVCLQERLRNAGTHEQQTTGVD